MPKLTIRRGERAYGGFVEISWAFHRREQSERPPVDLVEAHSGLAGLFIGDGVVDRDLVGALLDGSLAADQTLLTIAAGRRQEARRLYGAAFERFDEAIASARDTGAPELAAHAQFDAARMLLKRHEPGDPERARGLIESARQTALALRMDPLLARIDELV